MEVRINVRRGRSTETEGENLKGRKIGGRME